MRRLMEEENRKQQKAYRRQYNDRVRELVTFVRKRDKRVARYQVNYEPFSSPSGQMTPPGYRLRVDTLQAQEAERRLEADAEEERK